MKSACHCLIYSSILYSQLFGKQNFQEIMGINQINSQFNLLTSQR